MKHKLIVLLGLWLPLIGFAQTSESDSLKSSPDSVIVTGDADYSLGISYFGNNVFHPGLRADLEKAWKVKHKTKAKKNKKRGEYTLTKSKELLPTAGFGFYVHPRQHTGVSADVGIKFRKTRSKSYRNKIYRWFAGTGLGFHRSFLPETYEVKGTEVKKITLAGRSYFYPYVTLGTEKSWRNNPNHAMFTTLNCMFLTSYNTTTLPLVNFQAGYRFKFTKLKKNHAKSI